MKVLMINKFLYPNGGSETYMLKLGKQYEALGHDVQYFGMENEKNVAGNEYNMYVPEVDFHGSQKSVLKAIRTGIETVYSFTARKQLRKVLQAFKPDIVHLNNINFQLTPSILYEIKRSGIPMVQTVHDVQIACPCHRYYVEHRKEVCEECNGGKYQRCIQNKCVQNSLMKSALAAVESFYYHSRNTYNLIDRFICPSLFIGEKITQAGVDQNKVLTMYNFAEKKQSVWQLQNGGKYALFFGRLSHEKGIISLLKMAEALPEVKIVIAGRGPLERLVQEKADLMANVEYVGFKNGEELERLIAKAAFTLCPSEWYENCPLSVIESQLLGTPVIGSDLGGTRELIQQEKTGLIFEGHDLQGFINAVRKLWMDDSLRESMRNHCQQGKWQTCEEYAKTMLEIYAELIQKEA